MNIKTIKRIWGYIGKSKLQLTLLLICAVIGNLFLIFGPLLTGMGIDKIVGKGNVDFNGLIVIIILIVVLYLVGNFFLWLVSILSNIAANRTIHDMREDAFEKIGKLPLKYFDTNSHGDVISRLTNDMDAISDGLFQGITQVVSAVIIIFGCFMFMLTISVTITAVVVVITPLCFLIASFIAKQSKKMFANQSKSVGDLNGYIEEMIGNQKVVTAFGYEKKAFEGFAQRNDILYKWGQKAQWYSSLTNPTTRLINNIAYVAVTLIGSIMAVTGGFSIGKIASFITYSNQFAKPINEITSIASQIQSAFASAERVFSFIDEAEEIGQKGSDIILKEAKGKLEFENVKFSYRKEVPLIKNLNLSVNEGDMVAIVGPTGSGKTTLVNLIMRFYEVDDGHILLDGNIITKITRDSLRRSIGMVLQESWLFSGTVAQNIAYGKSDAKREDIINAAKEAKAHSFIVKMPNGYDTIIDEDGRNLSQGQKQLLTIARVMLMDPPILILDEATSSIDTRTEIKIQQAFRKMMEGRTSFVIAHRLSTIKEADTILVLKEGDIIEQGSHKSLMEKQGFYHMLYNSQFATSK